MGRLIATELSVRDALRNELGHEIDDRHRGDYPIDDGHAADWTMNWSSKAAEVEVDGLEADSRHGQHLPTCGIRSVPCLSRTHA